LYLTSNIHFYTYSTIIGNIYAYKLVIKRLYAKIREIWANILLEKSSTTKRFEAQEILFHPSLFSSPINPDTSGLMGEEKKVFYHSLPFHAQKSPKCKPVVVCRFIGVLNAPNKLGNYKVC